MPKFYDSLTPSLTKWAMQQPIFFVSSAPLYGKHINVSPKGLADSSLAIMGPREAAYIDMTGSGNETISHVRENGRVTVMFCSFEAMPRVLRLFCTGWVIEPKDEDNTMVFERVVERMGLKEKMLVGARAVIILNIFKVSLLFAFSLLLDFILGYFPIISVG